MAFHYMSCRFLFQKAENLQKSRTMTYAASVQMAGSFFFVTPVRELFTEVTSFIMHLYIICLASRGCMFPS